MANFIFHEDSPRRICHEAHIPTLKNPSSANPWIFSSHAHQWRPCRDSRSPRQRPGAVGGLSFPRTPLHKAQRLRHAEEFAAVFTHGRSRSGAYFRVHFKANHLPHGRLGLVVPKRIERRSPARNYVKRLIRELVRSREGEIQGLDLVVRLKKSISRAEGGVARADLASLLEGLA